ncbi:MAG: SurA N-terminal domain-containing protein [Cyclobacteriaceae bacterium]|jgi:peptidyl-prolyl cis-trans isomerase D
MALISKIREKTGLAVGIIAFGLILFLVGGDILGPNSVILGNNKAEVGEIAGQTIDHAEYIQQIEELKYNYTLNFNRNPSENEMIAIRQQAWDYLIVKKAFQKEFDKLGLSVTEEELVDMVQGKNIHPDLVQAFTNPQTGEFDREQIVMYLQQINQMPPQQQAGWYMFESNLEPSRLRLKFDNLLLKTDYVTESEAEALYKQENGVAEIKYLYIPYYSLSDTTVTVTDSDLENYLSEHQKTYYNEDTRSLIYVSFPIIPSSDDSLFFMDEMDKLAKEFAEIDDDSIYARINTDGDSPYETYTIGQLPARIRNDLDNLSPGYVIGPYLQTGNYVINKVTDILEDTMFYARASHILIKPESESSADKSRARQEAQSLLNQIRNGANFALIARDNSDDPSSSAGGDLGWFDENRMVKPFADAVFSRTSEGLVPRVVETEFGYHIINVTGKKTNKLFKVATIEREISASDITRDEAFRKADYFASLTANREEFDRNAANDSLTINEAESLKKDDRRIGGLGDAREIVRWAFLEASIDEASTVFELDDQYVIAVLTDKTEEGPAGLEDVRVQLTPKVKNELKAEYIIQKLNNLEGTLDEIAEQYGSEARVYESFDIKLSSNSIPNIGFAPVAVGTVFSMNEGETSEPIIENDGVVIIQLNSLIESPEIADYTSYKNQLTQRRSSRTSYLTSEAIKEYSDIVDERYRFF